MFQTKIVEKIKTHIRYKRYLEYGAMYEIMWRNLVQSDRPQMTIYEGRTESHEQQLFVK